MYSTNLDKTLNLDFISNINNNFNNNKKTNKNNKKEKFKNVHNGINNIKAIAYNCYGFKSNKQYICKLLYEFDICFFSELWLAEEEENLINELSNSHNFIYKADFSIATHKYGRPYSGTCWAIKKH